MQYFLVIWFHLVAQLNYLYWVVTSYACLSMWQCLANTRSNTQGYSLVQWQFSLKNCQWSLVNVFDYSSVRKKAIENKNKVSQGLLLVQCPWPKTFSGGLHFLSSITAREKRQKHTIHHITGDDVDAENWNLLAPCVPPPQLSIAPEPGSCR